MTPILGDEGIQERAQATLKENKRRPSRKNDRRYPLRGLVKCAVCGTACSGHSATSRGKMFYYYTCRAGRTNNFGTGRPHKPPYVNAGWGVWYGLRYGAS